MRKNERRYKHIYKPNTVLRIRGKPITIIKDYISFITTTILTFRDLPNNGFELNIDVCRNYLFAQQ